MAEERRRKPDGIRPWNRTAFGVGRHEHRRHRQWIRRTRGGHPAARAGARGHGRRAARPGRWPRVRVSPGRVHLRRRSDDHHRPLAHRRPLHARRAQDRRLRVDRPHRPVLRIRFEDGSSSRTTATASSCSREIRRFNPADEQGYLEAPEARARQVFECGHGSHRQAVHQAHRHGAVLPDLIRLRADRSSRTSSTPRSRTRACARCSRSTRCSSAAIRSRRHRSTRSSITSSRSGASGSRWAAPARSCRRSCSCFEDIGGRIRSRPRWRRSSSTNARGGRRGARRGGETLPPMRW
jgi:hypothetical protein